MADFWDTVHQFNGVRPAERDGMQRSAVGTLPEGEYEFRIKEADHKMAGKDGADKALLFLVLKVVTPARLAGTEVEHEYWLTDERAVSRCFADLVTLGMDPAGLFADGLRTFLPQLAGRCFLGRRKDNVSTTNGKTYQNFYVNQPVGAAAMPAPQRPSAPTTQPSQGHFVPGDDIQEIPF